MSFAGYACDACGGSFGPDEAFYGCPAGCGNLYVRVDLAAVSLDEIRHSSERSLWRYGSLIPVPRPDEGTGPLRSVGATPLYRADRLAQGLGMRRLWIKDEGRMPTGSLKDRASAIVVQRAIQIGAETVITASTGNAGVALAAMGCAAGVRTVILVPETAPAAKIAQLQVYGATLALVRGTYADAFELSERASAELGWYNRNTGRNPFTVEGKKTVSFEVVEELGWRAPDRIVVSVGDGNILVGVHKGLTELLELGWIDRMPRLLAVQAEGSSPIARAFAAGTDRIEPMETNTLADSISAGRPADGRRALSVVRSADGAFVTVTDDEILSAITALGREAAVFAEPSAAAAYAGLRKAVREETVDKDEEVVVLMTGTGLKDLAAARQAVGSPPPIIDPTLDALNAAIGTSQGRTSP